jgi:hypothetical protein
MQVLAPLSSRSVLLAALAVGLWAVGCAGNIDPSLLPSGQAGAGGPGTGGSTGTGGAPCDAVSMLLANPSKCGTASGCHGATSTQGIDFTAPGLVGRLVGKMPAGASPLCSTSTMPYLVASSNPATGLLFDKLKATPSCGLTMPFGGIGGAITPDEMTCLNDWATAATTGRIQ